LNLQGPKVLNSQSNYFSASLPTMGSATKGRDETVARRLRLLREAMGYDSQGAFAALLGLSPPRWNNVENGLPMSRDIAFRLVKTVPGLTLDWLYFGKPDGLPLDLARRLGEVAPGPGKRTTAPR
jgi:hypothetical protein